MCLLIFILVATPYARKKTTQKNDFPIESTKYKMILTVWNVDTFEGGKGSRSEFLADMGVEFGKKGVLVIVENHTIESAQTAVNGGQIPDLLSFGVGVDWAVNYAKELPSISYKGGEIGGKTYAYPWCMGGYFLISKSEDNRRIDRLIVSQNKFNLPFAVQYFSKIEAGKVEYLEPTKAYTTYLSSDKNSYLIGTQRDIVRLTQRGENFLATPLEEFSDIVQYIAVTTATKEKYEDCKNFIGFITSETCQKKIYKIGMMRVDGVEEESEVFSSFDKAKTSYTVSPFSQSEKIKRIIEEVNCQNKENLNLSAFKNTLKHL